MAPMASARFGPCKNKKRKQKLFGHKTFPGPGSVTDSWGPFRDSIRLFLQEFAEFEDYKVAGMPVWSVSLVDESNSVVFPLFIVEETARLSPHPFCDHCKCIGWSHHFVSKRRYHLIIPANDQWGNRLKTTSLNSHSNVLYGLIHCNGFGHLLCINGLNGDSNLLCGTDAMDLWDRLCSTLRTRKISVNDYSKKRNMEMRLLYGIAYGHSWFGKWGYKFGRGSFNVKEDEYNSAIQYLRALELDKIVDYFKNTRKGRTIEFIVENYREMTTRQLDTISDLLQLMLEIKINEPMQGTTTAKNASSRSPVVDSDDYDSQITDNPMSFTEFLSSLKTGDCKWPVRRLEYALAVILSILKEKADADGESTMIRPELREEVRQYIGDTGLIDFVLKSITCFTMDNNIVRRAVNPSTKLVEFSVHELVSEVKSSGYPDLFANSDSRWPEHRLKHAAEVIVSILKDQKEMINGKASMSRHELREAARQCIGDTGLIDFVLKSINNSVVGNQIVHRSKNPSTKVIEFAIQKIVNQRKIENMTESATLALEPGFNVWEDLRFLYKYVLLGYPQAHTVGLAIQDVLDSKQFVKEWQCKHELMMTQLMVLHCQVLPSFDELLSELTQPLSPGVLVVVSPTVTVGKLKGVAQCALRDTYCVMDKFVVNQIGGLKGMEDQRMLSDVVETGDRVWVRGYGLDLDTELRYEGGSDDWKVDCPCGAKVDDGERMVACDGCKLWQHTRCSGIDDNQAVHSLFLCASCRGRMSR